MFLFVFFFYGIYIEYINIIFYCLWFCYYVYRGIIYLWIMKYSSLKIFLGILLGGFFFNFFYSFFNVDWIGVVFYDFDYYKDLWFIVGVVMFIIGYIINRYVDLLFRKFRVNSSFGYFIFNGCLFYKIFCLNYFGEMFEWFGWVLGIWLVVGIVWFLFFSVILVL